ncbi:TlpA disulfide reductase family protein [Labilibaculum sp. K2S]|uniref:TlpA family protein disulfide reductase n=1 Tax=Labilibaculum sp. K2S TaxID=3056386 RepID=UPI0025A46B4E|nr:TlpA disulfide reductase family protein [Labilibaculum sp. K2S]MDM8159544.1 TlpA disulfide reductase family protein [Labilibaculum sp. K2S]
MYKLSVICAFLLLVSSCTPKEQAKFATVNGKILSSDAEKIEFMWFKENPAEPLGKTQTAKVDSAGHFSIDIPIQSISKGMMTCNNNRNSLVLSPGDKLEITVDGDSLRFEGTGAAENSFLYQLEKVKKCDRNELVRSWYTEDHTLEDMFKMITDYVNIRQSELAVFKQKHELQKEFLHFFEIETKIDNINLLQNAPLVYSRKNRKNIDSLQLPKGADKYKTFASVQNDEYLICSDYINLFNSLIRKEALKRMASDTTLSKEDAKLSVIMDSLSGKTREYTMLLEIYFNVTYRNTDDPKLIETFYKINTDDNCRKIADRELSKYEAKKAMIGAPLQQDILETTLFDSNENELTVRGMLDKYKGKVVYLDIWSLGCGPCRMAMPASKKLKEDLSDQAIEFVYMTVDKKSDNLWPEVYKVSQSEKNQYRFANGFNSKLHQLLSINAVPTYIIIDKDGRLISYNADRPNNPKLKEQLLQLAGR